MANIKFTNFARTALAVGVGSGDVTMSVTGGTGALFPALTAGQYFYATLENATLDREIVKVTARAADTFTVARAQDNTTARTWVAGDIVSLRFVAAAISDAVVGTLLAAHNLSDVGSAATARANIGALAAGDNIGAATATTPAAVDNSNRVATTAYVDTAVAAASQIQPIAASVAANALTITLNPTTLSFRSASLASGATNTRVIASAISLTISSGSTLGTVSAQQSRIVVLAIDNAGTVELAAVNLAGGNDLSETGLITTTAEGGAGGADTANVIYSTTARTNLPYRVVGYVESTQAIAGTWATAPSTIQGYGGQAFAAMSSLGYGQTWQDVSGSRVSGTTYYNTTGRPIAVSIRTSNTYLSASLDMHVNGVSRYGASWGGGTTSLNEPGFTIVPPGNSYAVFASGTLSWHELR